MDKRVKLASAAMAMTLAASPIPFSGALAANTAGCTPQERSNQTLSEKLDQTKGVICPPDVDPAMKAPTPKTGDKPALPAPGSPGGDPNVQPK